MADVYKFRVKLQELDKYLLLEGMLDERINKAIEAIAEEVGEEE